MAEQPDIALTPEKGARLGPYRQSIAGTLLATREAVMTPFRPMLREAGVTEQQWRVLRVLVDEGAIDMSRLASSAMILRPSASRILRELTSRGLIARRTDATDRRRYVVEITLEGRQLLETTAVHSQEVVARYSEAFGPERLRSLITELRAFSATIVRLYGAVDFTDSGA